MGVAEWISYGLCNKGQCQNQRECLREGSILLFEDCVMMGNASYSLQDAMDNSLSQQGSAKRGHGDAVLAIGGWGILSVSGRGMTHSAPAVTDWGAGVCH